MKQRHVGLALAAACAIASCGPREGTALPHAAMARAAAAPPHCPGQKMREQFAQIKVKLQTQSGSLCIPEFHGFGGTMQVPGVEQSVPARAPIQHEKHLRRAIARVGNGDLLFEPSLHRRNALQYEAKVDRRPDLRKDIARPNLQRLRHRCGRASHPDAPAMLRGGNSRSVRRYPSRDRSAFQRYDDHRRRIWCH